MKLEDFNFLLDENINHRVKDIFVKLNINFTTIQEQGLTGVSDKKLCTFTRDIYISIKPLNLQNIRMRLIDLFENNVLKVDKPFLLILQQENIRIIK